MGCHTFDHRRSGLESLELDINGGNESQISPCKQLRALGRKNAIANITRDADASFTIKWKHSVTSGVWPIKKKKKERVADDSLILRSLTRTRPMANSGYFLEHKSHYLGDRGMARNSTEKYKKSWMKSPLAANSERRNRIFGMALQEKWKQRERV